MCSVINDIQKQFPYRNIIGCMEIEESVSNIMTNQKKKSHSQKSRILIISCFYLVIQSYFGKLHSTFNYHFFSVVISEKKIEIADH